MNRDEAHTFLNNLKVCIEEHPIVADWLVEIADRKTEKSSEIPNNCEDEPTHSQHVQHIGSVETMSCEECKHWIFTSQWGWFCPLKGKDECNYEPIEDEPQTDCAWK